MLLISISIWNVIITSIFRGAVQHIMYASQHGMGTFEKKAGASLQYTKIAQKYWRQATGSHLCSYLHC